MEVNPFNLLFISKMRNALVITSYLFDNFLLYEHLEVCMLNKRNLDPDPYSANSVSKYQSPDSVLLEKVYAAGP